MTEEEVQVAFRVAAVVAVVSCAALLVFFWRVMQDVDEDGLPPEFRRRRR